MKTPPKLKAFFLYLTLLSAGFGGGCYTVEFFPEPDYPNFRLADVDEVDITYTRPEKSYQFLGKLIYRDFSGDIKDINFLSSVKREAAKRGAQGAWIKRRRIHRQTAFQAQTVDRRQGRRSPTGDLRNNVGLVDIILFNYKRESEKQN